MSATKPTPDDQPVDLAAIAADDLLLDALGRGAEAAPGDAVTDLLSAWRADLGSEMPDDAAGFRLAGALLAEEDDGRVPGEGPTAPGPARSGRLRRLALGAAAAAVAVAGFSVAVNHAGPGSPLWPITEVMYPQQAEVRAAEHTIALARTAATENRFDDARSLLGEAEIHVARVRDVGVAQRLRTEIDAIRRSLPAVVPTDSTPPAGPSTPPSSGPAPAATPAPAGGGKPGGSSAPDQPAPGLPGLPPIESPELPLPPLPLPPLPAPTLSLPALPLPDDGILPG